MKLSDIPEDLREHAKECIQKLRDEQKKHPGDPMFAGIPVAIHHKGDIVGVYSLFTPGPMTVSKMARNAPFPVITVLLGAHFRGEMMDGPPWMEGDNLKALRAIANAEPGHHVLLTVMPGGLEALVAATLYAGDTPLSTHVVTVAEIGSVVAKVVPVPGGDA